MLLALVTIFPFRCQLCRHRFLAFAGRITAGPRREYQRLSTRYPVTMREIHSGKHVTTGIIVDLSVQGCGIACKSPLKIEERVRLSIHVTDVDPPLEIDQAIVRTQQHERLGMEFVTVNPADEERLRRLIQSRLTTTAPAGVPVGHVPV